MGKNQAYKAMQRARMSSTSGAPENIEDGMMDGSFHSPEWHAARLASLNTSHTITWEEFKKKQREDALRRDELEADKDRMMREYRAQLDAERASKLASGRNHSRHKITLKEKKEKEKRSRKKKRSRKSSESSSSSSSSETSGSDDEDDKRESKRRKSKSKKSSKEKRHKSRSKRPVNDDKADGPVPLSKFFNAVQSGLPVLGKTDHVWQTNAID
ncbi:uncharacterized protein LOC116248029 isoform X2 [Nymphaea colorata]|nr:uncharacterized protein LOC116248029 isoform X1 [Nymphaea colorata]XP_049931992.1 uncharacterized protein LOC116248029 isoform X2 [Nymphaea colorata]